MHPAGNMHVNHRITLALLHNEVSLAQHIVADPGKLQALLDNPLFRQACADVGFAPEALLPPTPQAFRYDPATRKGRTPEALAATLVQAEVDRLKKLALAVTRYRDIAAAADKERRRQLQQARRAAMAEEVAMVEAERLAGEQAAALAGPRRGSELCRPPAAPGDGEDGGSRPTAAAHSATAEGRRRSIVERLSEAGRTSMDFSALTVPGDGVVQPIAGMGPGALRSGEGSGVGGGGGRSEGGGGGGSLYSVPSIPESLSMASGWPDNKASAVSATAISTARGVHTASRLAPPAAGLVSEGDGRDRDEVRRPSRGRSGSRPTSSVANVPRHGISIVTTVPSLRMASPSMYAQEAGHGVPDTARGPAAARREADLEAEAAAVGLPLQLLQRYYAQKAARLVRLGETETAASMAAVLAAGSGQLRS
jgi:hypothetical protein